MTQSCRTVCCICFLFLLLTVTVCSLYYFINSNVCKQLLCFFKTNTFKEKLMKNSVCIARNMKNCNKVITDIDLNSLYTKINVICNIIISTIKWGGGHIISIRANDSKCCHYRSSHYFCTDE